MLGAVGGNAEAAGTLIDEEEEESVPLFGSPSSPDGQGPPDSQAYSTFIVAGGDRTRCRGSAFTSLAQETNRQ